MLLMVMLCCLCVCNNKRLTWNGYLAKIEDPDLPIPKVDTIISEPIGVLLFHERMVRT